MKRLGCCAALALLAGCGGYTSPWTSYDCTVERAGDNGRFRFNGEDVSWTYDAAEGLEVVVAAPPYDTSFLETGFAGPTQPPLTVRFSSGVDSQEGASPGLSVDVRIGERALRAEGSNLNAATFSYPDWSALLAEEGDMRVALIDDRNGAVLRSGVVPRSALDSAEPTLEEAGTEFVDKVLHQEDRCTPFIPPGAGIIVV